MIIWVSPLNNPSPSLGGKTLLNALGHLVDGGVLAELLDLFVLGDLWQADASGDLAVHAQDGGDLLFGEQEDLEHQVVALVGAAGHAGLAHPDEGGQQSR